MGGGGSGKDVRLSGETCGGGASCDAATSGTSAAKPRKAGRAVVGVGDLHSSGDLADIITPGERREGTGSHALHSGKGPDDGWGDELWIKNVTEGSEAARCAISESKSGAALAVL